MTIDARRPLGTVANLPPPPRDTDPGARGPRSPAQPAAAGVCKRGHYVWEILEFRWVGSPHNIFLPASLPSLDFTQPLEGSMKVSQGPSPPPLEARPR